MCLENPTTKEPKVAKENITVYKVGEGVRVFKSRYLSYRYHLNKKQPHVKIFYGDAIQEGYHSYSSLKGAKENRFGTRVGEFVIPKGTKYYEGRFLDVVSIVSETIIFKGFIK